MRVGVGRAVRERGAALGLQLVAEVADEAAGEVEGELPILDRAAAPASARASRAGRCDGLAAPAAAERQLGGAPRRG